MSFLKFISKFFLILILALAFSAASASETDGTIDTTYYSALLCTNDSCTTTSQINFKPTYGNGIHITDAGITGDAWSEDMGWIRFDPGGGYGGVANNEQGQLSGYAWGENSGWINFGPFSNNSATTVTINGSGEFYGWAWAQNYGWIKFDCAVTNACVKTDWRPIGERTSGTTSGSSATPTSPTPTPVPPTPAITEPTIPTIPPVEQQEPTTPETPATEEEPAIDEVTTPPGPTEPTNEGPSILNTVSETISNISNNVVNAVSSRLSTSFIVAKNIASTAGTKVVLGLSQTSTKIKEIEEIPAVNVTSKVVTATGAATGATISVATVLFANPLSMSEIFLIPFRLWSLLMTALGLKKRNRPWGTVYDSVTKQPLDPAYVILQDLSGNEVATSITDLDGRYGFLVPPGKYKMIASKTNYQFPSTKLVGKMQDELYPELYFNETIDVTEGGVISKNIPMDPLKFDWNEFAKKDQKLMKFFSTRDLWILRISNILFIFGFLVTIIAVIGSFAPYNIAILIIYVVLFILKRTILKPRPYGYVRQRDSLNPLSFAIIRVLFAGSENEVIHKVADKTGKYYCLVPNGRYYVKIEKKNSDESYTPIYTSEPIEVKDGFINQAFIV